MNDVCLGLAKAVVFEKKCADAYWEARNRHPHSRQLHDELYHAWNQAGGDRVQAERAVLDAALAIGRRLL